MSGTAFWKVRVPRTFVGAKWAARRRRSTAHVVALLFGLTIAAFVGVAFASADEAIELLQSDIQVARDGAVHVVETIRANAEGNLIRHGIYRDISTNFEDAEHNVHSVGFDLISLTRDGQPEPYHIERHSDFLRIYAGDADVFVPSGVHTYVLTYETDRQVRWIDDKPELFWNVTGNAWDFPVLKASARLSLPENSSPVAWDAYTGGLGERGKDFHGAVGSDGVLTVETTRRLEPGEGLTIVAGIAPGAVDRPTGMTAFRYFLLDNREWLIGLAGLLVVLGYFVWAWNRVGRDPKGGTIIPLFHPPKGVSAALASYIRNWGFGASAWKAFTASALALAVRGLLVFDQEGKDLVFERTAAPAEGVRAELPAGERTVLDWVDQQGGKAAITKANGKAVAKIGTAFQASVKAESGGRYFKNNFLHFAIGVLLSIATVGAVIVFGGIPDDEIGLLIGALMVGVFLSVFLVPIVTSLLDGKGSGGAVVGLIVFLVVVAIVLYFLWKVGNDLYGGVGPMLTAVAHALNGHALPFALALVLPLLNAVFLYLLRAPTPEGRPVMDEIEGFRMYLETAESGRLNIEKAPEITAERFEALLPYAVALGVEKPWADAFASALARAHPGDQDPMSYYRPGWRRGGSWSSNNFGRSVATAVASATAAASAAIPRSSSSSSGFSGGSGGGGGGRGGGGW